jgi:hypothetical protein
LFFAAVHRIANIEEVPAADSGEFEDNRVAHLMVFVEAGLVDRTTLSIAIEGTLRAYKAWINKQVPSQEDERQRFQNPNSRSKPQPDQIALSFHFVFLFQCDKRRRKQKSANCFDSGRDVMQKPRVARMRKSRGRISGDSRLCRFCRADGSHIDE